MKIRNVLIGSAATVFAIGLTTMLASASIGNNTSGIKQAAATSHVAGFALAEAHGGAGHETIDRRGHGSDDPPGHDAKDKDKGGNGSDDPPDHDANDDKGKGRGHGGDDPPGHH